MKTFVALLLLVGLSGCLAATNKSCAPCKRFFTLFSNITHGGVEMKKSFANLFSQYYDGPKVWTEKSVGQFFDVMNRNLDVNTICYDIKACDDGLDDGIRELTHFESDTNCEFCVFVTQRVKEIVAGGPTEVEIKSYLEDACHYTLGLKDECLKMVDENVDEIFKYINEKFQPEDFCKAIRMCPRKTGVLKPVLSASSLATLMPVNMTVSEETAPGPNCYLCKRLVKIIQVQLKDNATDEQILHVLEEVCYAFPKSDQEPCKQQVENYGRQMIAILTNDIDSDTACTIIGLCMPEHFDKYLTGQYLNSVESNVACVECELIAHYIQNELYKYKNEEQVEEFIEHHLCNRLALFINQSDCAAFVHQYGPLIIQTIAQELFDPNTLCFKEIPVCHRKPAPKPIEPSHVHQNEKCQVCQDIASHMRSLGSSKVEIEAIKERACSRVSKPLRVECKLMVQAFGPYFFEMVHRYENSFDLCKSMDLCMVPGHVHLLGAEKCTYGPSYWCHTSAHAEACNALDYCKEKFWKP